MAKISMDTDSKELIIEASFKDFETLLSRAQTFYELLKEQPELVQSLGSMKSIFEGVDQRIQILIRPVPDPKPGINDIIVDAMTNLGALTGSFGFNVMSNAPNWTSTPTVQPIKKIEPVDKEDDNQFNREG